MLPVYTAWHPLLLLTAGELPPLRLAETTIHPAATLPWQDGTRNPPTRLHSTSWKWLFWFMEQDGTVKSVILIGQNKVSASPPPEPKEASRGHPQAHSNQPDSRARPCLCHPGL